MTSPFFSRALVLFLLALLPSCGGRALYRIEFADEPVSRKGNWKAKVPAFIVVSDTQYASPFTDYDLVYRLGNQYIRLPPALSTMAARSFYRNAESHFSVPLAFESILTRAVSDRYGLGLFAGDMAEFSCKAEAERMFRVLARHPEVKFIVTIGNHDATFHGSYDTSAGAVISGGSDWDLYSFQLWQSVCLREGGLLTKSGFIEQILDYYAKVWGLDYRTARAGKELEPGEHAQGVVTNRGTGWTLEFDIALAFDKERDAHRQSHLYQRFTWTDPNGREEPLAFTSLDTTDYGARPVLCSTSSVAETAAQRLVQIGLAGAVSDEQVSWLEERPVARTTPHFVLSHYLPFQDVEGLSSCDSTFGTRCLGNRLMTALLGSTYIYGHVHQDFKEGTIERSASVPPGRGRSAPGLVDDACEALATNPIVRIPSLIDNRAYVVFDGDKFESRSVEGVKDVKGQIPFKLETTTCMQRVREYEELKSLIECLQQQGKEATCLSARAANRETATVALQSTLCHNDARAWVTANDAQMKSYQAVPLALDPKDPESDLSSVGVCKDWDAVTQWRCILRGLAYDALARSTLSTAGKLKLGEKLLSVVEPLRVNHDEEHR
jgi:hypothetical protein